MSGRKFKCPICSERDTENNMRIDYVNGQRKRFHHICHDKFIADQEFKKQEGEELDSLIETIKKLHGIEIIPNQFYSFLQDIRNGNEMFGRIGKKKSKEGYSYKIIEQTYLECRDSINWAINNKDFKGTLNLLKYTRAIILDKIDGVNYKVNNRARKQEIEQSTEDQAINVFEHVERQPAVYKRRKSEKDASSFLD